jgi:hypothetical protein
MMQFAKELEIAQHKQHIKHAFKTHFMSTIKFHYAIEKQTKKILIFSKPLLPFSFHWFPSGEDNLIRDTLGH